MLKKISHHVVPLSLLFLTWGVFFLWALRNIFSLNKNGDIETKFWTVSGDWAMHLSQVQAFSGHGFFEVLNNNPIYAGEILSYPFFINFLSGKILSITNNLEFSLLLPLFILFPLLLFGLYFSGYFLTNSRKASILGIFFFFLGGGSAISLWNEQFLGSSGFMQNTLLEEEGYFWKSFFLTLLFPQRALFFGITIGSILLAIFLFWRQKNFEKVSTLKLFFLGAGLGCLSFIHTHSFLFFALFGLAISLFEWKNFKKFFWIFLGSFIFSLPFLLFLTNSPSTFIPQLQWIWMGEKFSENFFIFWLQNWGIFFLFGIFLLFWALGLIFLKKQKNFSIPIIFSIVFIFLFANFLQLQENPWDNGKIFAWVFLFLSFFAAKFCISIWRKSFTEKYISITFIFLGTVSGIFLLFQPVSNTAITIFSKEDIHMSKAFSEQIHRKKLVLTPNYHLLFVPTLTKNSIFMGYSGWIHSYGIDYRKRQRDIEKIYAGVSESKELLQKHGIDVVVVAPYLQKNMVLNKEFFDTNFKEIISNQWVFVYEVK